MEQFRTLYAEIQDLDRRQLISVDLIKRWCILLLIIFAVFSYSWHRIFSYTHDSHIPRVLLPPELQNKELDFMYQTEEELRYARMRAINFVIFACMPSTNQHEKRNEESGLHIALEAIRTMKSAALFSRKIIHFHVYTEDALLPTFIAELDKWPNIIRHRVTFQFHSAAFPETLLDDVTDTKGNRASQKACDLAFLFVPTMVEDLDYVMYARSGVIFLHAIDELLSDFNYYGSEHYIGLPLKDSGALPMCKLSSGYLQNPTQLNIFDSTIIQFHVQRLTLGLFSIPVARKPEFSNEEWFPIDVNQYIVVNATWNPQMLLAVYKLFKHAVSSPGQDILNIIAYFNLDRIFPLPCDWNFHLSTCAVHGELCPASKLVVPEETTDYCPNYPEFKNLCDLIENTAFETFNITNFKFSIDNMKHKMYKYWPIMTQCSLKNVDVFERTISCYHN